MEICRVDIGGEKDKVKVIEDFNPFIVNEILPLSIRPIGNGIYMILFSAVCNTTEEKMFFNVPVRSINNTDANFFRNHPLNLNKITENKDRLQTYVEFTKDAVEDSVFVTDFDMTQDIMSPIMYTVDASRKISSTEVVKKKINITRECFVRINLFFIRLKNHDMTGIEVFFDKKLKNIKFTTVDHVKLDGSGTDIASRIVCSHYTCGNGPEIYKFNYISIKLVGERLRVPLSADLYEKFYSDDYTITDIFYDYHSDSIFVLYEVRSDITNKYKESKMLIFPKDLYEKTNFADAMRIYEESTK